MAKRELIKRDKRLGDLVSQALSTIGVTEDRVEKWLGRPCGCPERRKMLNQLDEWARGLFSRDKPADEKVEEAKTQLDGIIGDVKPPEVTAGGGQG